MHAGIATDIHLSPCREPAARSDRHADPNPLTLYAAQQLLLEYIHMSMTGGMDRSGMTWTV